MDLGLSGRSAIVAGSSRGIGLAIADGFLAEGANVTITGRDQTALDAAAADLRGRHGHDRVAAATADLADAAAASEAVAVAADAFGAPDCVVLNAGTGRAPGGATPGAQGWTDSLAANLWTAIHVTEAALPAMVERGSGSLVFIASIAGLEAFGAPLPYNSAKAAVVAYAAGLARELGPRGIRANSVAPGNVLFPGGSWERKLEEDRERVMGFVERDVPLQRFARPQEVADAVLFLASERASFVTGECLVVDGGQTKRIA